MKEYLMKKASKNIIRTLLDKVMDENSINYNPKAIALNEIQKAKGKTHYLNFDFDGVNVEDIGEILINRDSYIILQTRGGFHLLINPDKIEKQYMKNWYKNITNLKGCDGLKTYDLIPIVGCNQGGFVPKFIV